MIEFVAVLIELCVEWEKLGSGVGGGDFSGGAGGWLGGRVYIRGMHVGLL